MGIAGHPGPLLSFGHGRMVLQVVPGFLGGSGGTEADVLATGYVRDSLADPGVPARPKRDPSSPTSRTSSGDGDPKRLGTTDREESEPCHRQVPTTTPPATTVAATSAAARNTSRR